ncbi:hypothetical protein [Actinoplanes sp. NPDC026623]|uniref:hypothetical protein n=1 Tax=Actinoplanes sp. NPDC026623 TaxID=3155610 RepID=UPI00340B4EB6
MQEEPTRHDEPAMVEELMWVKRPAGANLFHSQKEPGSFTSGFRTPDSGNLGQSTLRPAAHQEEVNSTCAPQPNIRYTADPHSRAGEEFRALLAQAGVVITRELIRRATPVVLKWLGDEVIPSAKAKLKAVRDRTGRRRTTIAKAAATRESVASTGQETAAQPPPVDMVHEAVIFGTHRRVMGRMEALERLSAARAAELFRDEQLRIVRESRIVDDEDLPELDAAAMTRAQAPLEANGPLILESTASPVDFLMAIQLSDFQDTDRGPRDAVPRNPA